MVGLEAGALHWEIPGRCFIVESNIRRFITILLLRYACYAIVKEPSHGSFSHPFHPCLCDKPTP